MRNNLQFASYEFDEGWFQSVLNIFLLYLSKLNTLKYCTNSFSSIILKFIVFGG